MKRKLRIIFAAIFFTAITLLFLDFTGTLHAYLGWMAKIQFLPAVLAMNFAVTGILLVLTLIFGRLYCSVICPLGVMQDIISWSRGKWKKKERFRFKYQPERKILRWFVLGFFIATLAGGAHSIAVLIAPYSAYGRIAGNLFAPIYKYGNNLLAWIAERADSYAFYSTEVWVKSTSVLIVAIITFIVIFVLAWRNGRSWCNNICPVGTILGFFSRYSILAPVIDTDKCTNCGLCGKGCKASCIDTKEHKIDYSRCVVCFDCIDNCKSGALKYTLRKGKTQSETTNQEGRRAFIASAAIAIGTAATAKAEVKADGGLAEVSKAKKPERQLPVVPAGSESLKHFDSHCTACQLCVSACPNNVLRPSSSFDRFMLPEMGYENGWCRTECALCSEICPAGAIKKVSREEKSSIQIGLAVINYDNCIVNTDGVNCGNCSRHCPAEAIRMVDKTPGVENGLKIPAVNEQKCIGCGACEHICPARPFTAIHIDGYQVQKTK